MPAEKTRLSLIVPARNAAATLDACLKAIEASRQKPDEVIVVNDGSTDATQDIAARHTCRLVNIDLAQGPMQARLAGVRQAKSSILAFVDADVVVKPDTFGRITAFFDQNPGVDAVTGCLARDGHTGRFFSEYKNEYMNYIFNRQGRGVDFLYGSVWAIRRPHLWDFEPTPMPWGCLVSDTELGFKLRLKGKRIALDHGLEVEHRKSYSFTSLLKNDFVIPFSFAVLLSRYGRSLGSLRRGRFSHVARGQTLAAGLVFLAVLSAPAAAFWGGIFLWAGLAALIGFYAYWRHFLKRCFQRGFGFGLGTAIFKPLDATVMACGVLSGLFYAFFSNPSPRTGSAGRGPRGGVRSRHKGIRIASVFEPQGFEF